MTHKNIDLIPQVPSGPITNPSFRNWLFENFACISRFFPRHFKFDLTTTNTDLVIIPGICKIESLGDNQSLKLTALIALTYQWQRDTTIVFSGNLAANNTSTLNALNVDGRIMNLFLTSRTSSLNLHLFGITYNQIIFATCFRDLK